MMQGFVAGLDGGGTKTAVCCLDPSGRELERTAFGALNINGAPPEQVRQTLAQIMAWIAAREAQWGACHAIVVGTAGASNPNAVALITEAIGGSGSKARLLVTGDQSIALRGAVGKAGAVLIAGTGTICCGRNAGGETHRSGGYGYLIDDEGSGYAIGRDILSAVVRAQDGRGGATCLTGLVYEAWGIGSIPELIRETYAHATEKSHMAAVAPLLLKGLEAGDPASQCIAEKAAAELSGLLSTVLDKLSLSEGPFAFTGGILQHYPTIIEGVLTRIGALFPHAKHIQPLGDAALGAAQLALDSTQ